MEKYFSVSNLDCAHCGAKIEEAISKLEGIESAVLNFPMKKFKIKGNITDELVAKINEVANSIEAGVVIAAIEEAHHHSRRHEHEHEHHHHHDEECGCGHEHEHEHHHHDEECGCGHEHEHEHHHHHDEECGCGHEHEHEHHHHDEECGCGHEHEHDHHHGNDDDFIIENLDCAHCGAKIEEAISRIDGVESAVLNFPMKKFRIKGNITDELLEKINQVANGIEAGVVISHAAKERHSSEEHEKHHEEAEHTHSHNDNTEGLKNDIIPLIIGIVVFAAALLSGKIFDIKPLTIALYVAAYLILGYNVLIATFRNLKNKNFFDENFLMTVATIGAFVLGEYAEAVGVVLFFRIGELFENYAVSRSRKAITDVAGLKVEEADVLIDGEFRRIHSDEIEVGDILRIKAGERIAADGIVESGESRIDTSAVNGEPVPLTVRKGDEVLSGCINLSDTFTLKATAAASDSMISKIAQAVEDASATKPKIDRFITRFAKIYTPIVIAIAVLTAIVPSLITGDWSKWIYSALTFLVISCPCALVLSVPLAYFSGIGAASKLGILFKGGNAIEALGKVKAVAFDKTGTLTNGSFSVTEVRSYGKLGEKELLSICGSCEQSSTHPVAESIVDYCKENDSRLFTPEKTSEIAGRGVSAVLDGRNILCGNERLMSENNISVPEEETPLGSIVYVAVDGEIQGRIVVSDTVKKTSAEAVSQLRQMGIATAMLTGDKNDNAQAMAKQLGVDSAKGDLLPDGKLAEIERIRKENGAVMFVGDGFNDGPVLAGADVGGAMHSGSDLALEAADAVFMNSEPDSVVKAKKIADKTLRISYENIIFALAVKAAVLLLGLVGHPNMWLAVFADSGTAMLLILNSIRVLNIRKYK
ncbi:heavy metal translocating P-type ATPase [Ruminococcus sp.]|uniref:heavy metal translocating P-type ATPase n=3 Tax=Ruminococcus sp. TaxID=41978 RepID=UPI002B69C3C3|nr:heavy metal translocating P-type ATPase [Ruminococcus sp.]HOA00473.1 heavy metal translocating P-type ATPase [Ruminococcus sp.]